MVKEKVRRFGGRSRVGSATARETIMKLHVDHCKRQPGDFLVAGLAGLIAFDALEFFAAVGICLLWHHHLMLPKGAAGALRLSSYQHGAGSGVELSFLCLQASGMTTRNLVCAQWTQFSVDSR